MDETDFTILAHLARAPLASVSAMAAEVGLTRNAVQARMQRLKGDGILALEAVPNARLFDCAMLLAVYAPPRGDAQARLADVLEAPGVVSYALTHDDQVVVTYYAATEGAAPPPGVDALLGGPPQRSYARPAPPVQPPGAAMSALQWDVALALLDDPRMPAARMAEVVGRDARTVTRTRERLIEGGRVQVVAWVYAARVEGFVPFHLFVQGAATRPVRDLLRLLPRASLVEALGSPPGAFVFCGARTLGEALAAKDRVAALPGIDHVEVVLEREGGLAKAQLRRMCREARAKAVGARTSPAGGDDAGAPSGS